MPETSVETPLGWLRLTEVGNVLTAIDWGRGADDETPLLIEAAAQLKSYFSGDLKAFSLPVLTPDQPLQRAVSAQMQAIPFGETRTYGQIAEAVGVAAQPVGQACGNNRIPIVVPCHRVVGAQGLGGFSAPGGVETKVKLLRHEQAYGLLI